MGRAIVLKYSQGACYCVKVFSGAQEPVFKTFSCLMIFCT